MIYVMFFEKNDNTHIYYKRRIDGKRIYAELLHDQFLSSIPRINEIVHIDYLYYKVLEVEYYLSASEIYSQILIEKIED